MIRSASIVVICIALSLSMTVPMVAIAQDDNTNTTTEDVSDVIDIDIDEGNEMLFTIHDLNLEQEDDVYREDPTVIEYSEQTEDDTLVHLRVHDVPENVSHFNIYRDGNLVSQSQLGVFDLRSNFEDDPDLDAKGLLDETTPEVRFDPDNQTLDIWTYAWDEDGEQDWHYGVVKANGVIGVGELCHGIQYEFNEDGKLVSANDGETSFAECEDEENLSEWNVTDGNVTIQDGDQITLEHNDYDYTFPDLDDFDVITRVTFDEVVELGEDEVGVQPFETTTKEQSEVLFTGDISDLDDLQIEGESFLRTETVGGETIGLPSNGVYEFSRDIVALDSNGNEIQRQETVQEVDESVYNEPEYVEVVGIDNVNIHTEIVTGDINTDVEFDVFDRSVTIQNSDRFSGQFEPVEDTVGATEAFDATTTVENIHGEDIDGANLVISHIEDGSETELAHQNVDFNMGEERELTFTVNSDGSHEFDQGINIIGLYEKRDGDLERIASTGIYVGDIDTPPQDVYDDHTEFTGTLDAPELISGEHSYMADATLEWQGDDTDTTEVTGDHALFLVDGTTDYQASDTIQSSTFEEGIAEDEIYQINDASSISEVPDGAYNLVLVTDANREEFEVVDSQAAYVEQEFDDPEDEIIVDGRSGYAMSDVFDGDLLVDDLLHPDDKLDMDSQIENLLNEDVNADLRVEILEQGDDMVSLREGLEFESAGVRDLIFPTNYDNDDLEDVSEMPEDATSGELPDEPGVYTLLLLEQSDDEWKGVDARGVYVGNALSESPPESAFDIATRVTFTENVTYESDLGEVDFQEEIASVLWDEQLSGVHTIEVTDEMIVENNPEENEVFVEKDVHAHHSGDDSPATVTVTQEFDTEEVDVHSDQWDGDLENVEIDVEGINQVEYVYIGENTNYTALPGANGSFIDPISQIDPINDTTLNDTYIDVPGDGSYQWEVCDVEMQRPEGEGESNQFLVHENTLVHMFPNGVVVQDLTVDPATGDGNTTYNYPSQNEVDVEGPHGELIVLNTNHVYIPGCAFVMDIGDGVNLPGVGDRDDFTQLENTYYLDTWMTIEPFGLIGAVPDQVGEEVEGVAFNPQWGDVDARINMLDRDRADVFGATVSEFELRDGEDGAPVEITFRSLDDNREYTLYEDGDAIATERTGSQGDITFTRDGEWSSKEFSVVAGEETEEPGDSVTAALPSVELSTPAMILLAILAILLLVSGYLFYRRSDFGDDEESVAYY